MRYRSVLASIIFGLSFSGVVLGQESHIETSYMKETDATSVNTDELYVINMPTQFMSVQLSATYPKKGSPAQAPNRISIRFSSFAPQPLYEPEQAHQLRVKIDDRVFDFGILNYVKLVGLNGKNYDRRYGLPSVALLKASKTEVLGVEIMMAKDFTFADVSMLAGAKSVVMKIGDTVFPLTATQISILREFVAALTPAKAES